jgi:hypothetical protein
MNNVTLEILRDLTRLDAEKLLLAGDSEKYNQLNKSLSLAITNGLIKANIKHMQFIFYPNRPITIEPMF